MLKIREIKPDEYAFLRVMLFEAIYVPAGMEKPSDTVLGPLIEKYVANFGRPGDHALVLGERYELAGAIWVRQFNSDEQGYGFVDDATPELGIALFEKFRGQGYGSRMLTAMCEKLVDAGIGQVSLSVDKQSPAVRLYQRCGFEIIDEVGKGYTMLKRL